MRTMDFTTEQPDCCSVGDYLEIVEHELPTSYWYMLEHAYGASTNFKNRERLKTRKGKVIKIWKDDRFNYIDDVAPQKKANSSLAIYVDKNSSHNVVETIDDLLNTDGIIDVNQNSDGSNRYYGTDWGGAFHID